MAVTLGLALCQGGLATGFAEVRRLIASQAVTINGKTATAWDQPVMVGDVLKVGKHRTCVVK